MTWDALHSQPAAAAILRASVARDEISHAWLFVGPPGVGQREAVRALAAELNCPDRPDGGACGVCSTCRRIKAGTHPALWEFEPEGASHLVDGVREEWIPAASLTLVEGRRKVLRVVAADRMNEGAQNAFLKVLEEPPAPVVWILEAEDEESLLDTVVSRCRRVYFVPWGVDALDEYAARLGVAEERRAALVRAAMGSPQRVADLADPEVADVRHEHLAIVGRLLEDGAAAVVPIAKSLDTWARGRRKARAAVNAAELARLEECFGGAWPPGVKGRLQKRFERFERDERQRALQIVLDDLGSYLRDLLAIATGAGATQVVNADHAAQLRRDVARIPPLVALAGLAAVAECADAFERNGQPELHLERLLLRLAASLEQSRG
ncbi:MAG: DNA polymerase III subunit [Actinomycetota bacterium]|nr:DNA polymerase III subunit [Actinomycetota bacterium]